MFAQSPQGVGYQGVATDLNGVELINQTISIQASVLSSSATGNVEWQEQHSVTTDAFGLFTLTIGQGTSTGNGTQANFADISWGSAIHFLKIEMDFNGGTNFSHFGTNQMMSVPYALYAENSNVNYDSISTILSNDTSYSIYLQCVDMGVSLICPGLGLDPSFPLASNNNYNYDMDPNVNLNGNNYIDKPHWRKFKVVGLDNLLPGGQLMFIHKSIYVNHSNVTSTTYPAYHFLTPEINNGNVYFYMFEVASSSSCGNETNIFLSIPSTHSWRVEYSTYPKSFKNNFEIYYETSTGFKSTGIIFDR